MSECLTQPQHGGRMADIQLRYPHVSNAWLDLSTGVSPFSYPIKNVPYDDFQSLPQFDKRLAQAAAEYYGVKNGLMIPGSLWAIRHMPLLVGAQYLRANRVNESKAPTRVLLPRQGFSEHHWSWRQSGAHISVYDHEPSLQQLQSHDVCVVINPNNPSTHLLSLERLEAMAQQIDHGEGWLVVDEAFVDSNPQLSVLFGSNANGNGSVYQRNPNVIVLRSFGKFFGLPGIRLGALMANETVINGAQQWLGPWAITQQAQTIATGAYLDQAWHKKAVYELKTMSERLTGLLSQYFLNVNQTDFFTTVYLSRAKVVHEHLLNQGIYVRLLDDETGLRFGLPKDETDFIRLSNELKNLTE